MTSNDHVYCMHAPSCLVGHWMQPDVLGSVGVLARWFDTCQPTARAKRQGMGVARLPPNWNQPP